jgi:hypothetical protein
MKIYLAGNGAMSKEQLESLYNPPQLLKRRLLSFWEIQPERFCHGQWRWLNENIFGVRPRRKVI